MKKITLLSVMTLLSYFVNAQPYLTPLSINPDIYPTPGTNIIANSAYSVTAFFNNSGPGEFCVSGWTNSGLCCSGKIVWRFLSSTISAPASPAVISQGVIPISGGNIEAVYSSINGGDYICTAYYTNGAFVFERYKWNGTTFVLYTSDTLSTMPHKVINMDTYLGAHIAIVWDEYDPLMPIPGYVIKCMLVNDLTQTQVITLSGTENYAYPDVALSKSNGGSPGGLEAHIVYHDFNSTEIVEASIPFLTVFAANPASYSPVVEDVNNITGTTLYNFATIDCPQVCTFAPSASWAYTYCDNEGLKVRLSEPVTSVAPITKNIVNGTDFPNFDVTPYGTFSESTIAYDITGQSIHVGGRITGTPGLEGLFAAEISSDGTTLVGPTAPYDYQLISLDPDSKNLHFSKDDKYSSYMYAVYSGNNNESTHLFHQWGDVAFRGHGTTGVGNVTENKDLKITFSPNPFKNYLHTTIPAVLLNKDVVTTLTTINGRSLYSGVIRGKQFETDLHAVVADLPAGMYLLTTSNAELNYIQNQKIIKVD
ncbi:T9SS type A sorting domain-containing protein [Taibaiella lutea]|uniref:T9SS type A sorting domain-containing protein n=1 Tax=Taibaiella lutea TaxID=2608001 RepID=A0A5M6CIU1_9BACT|nr:T9SS type A sorting domain-containing protein [Taibaiella lutea]KAA5533315.1 T9SS type A sorting domain-containing protein [Taibaiella lutea]